MSLTIGAKVELAHKRGFGYGPTLGSISRPEKTLFVALAHMPPCDHWVSSGTLLGLYRDGCFIPDDTDLDVSIRVPVDKRIAVNLPNRFKPVRTQTADGLPMQTAFEDTDNGGLVFDIYYFYEGVEPGLLINLNRSTPGGVIRKPADIFEPISQWESPVGLIPTPHDIPVYLTMRYGEHWKKPVHGKGSLYAAGKAGT